jgi:hypothetical protein
MPYLTRVAAGKGTFTTMPVDGKDMPAILQERDSDCGPTCVGLVLRLTNHPEALAMTPAALRAASQERAGTGYYRPTAKDAVGGRGYRPTPGTHALARIMTNSVREKGWEGTYPENLVKMLKYRFRFEHAWYYTTPELKHWLRHATFQHPIIVEVAWESGGSHFFVACGYRKIGSAGGHYAVTDPIFGVGEIRLEMEDDPGGGCRQPVYAPAPEARGHLTGRFVSTEKYAH